MSVGGRERGKREGEGEREKGIEAGSEVGRKEEKYLLLMQIKPKIIMMTNITAATPPITLPTIIGRNSNLLPVLSVFHVLVVPLEESTTKQLCFVMLPYKHITKNKQGYIYAEICKGVENLEYLKRGEEAQLQAASGGAL